jgi:hypothetical protein
MSNPETLATLGTQDTGRKAKNIMSNTDLSKNRELAHVSAKGTQFDVKR